MRKSINYIIFIVLLAAIACKKEGSSEYTAKPVVEAYLMAGQPIHLHITKEILYTASTDSVETIDNLQVKIIHKNSQYLLLATGSGEYVSDSTYKVIEGDTYDLEFEYNNMTVTATTIIPSKPSGLTSSADSITIEPRDTTSHTMPTFPDPIALTWNNPSLDYFLVVVKNTETIETPINTRSEGGRPRTFRNEPSQINSYDIQAMSFIYYGLHHIILYKLNTEYALLYKDNGNNSQNLTKVTSNINNGLGIFTGINADSVAVKVIQ